MPARGERAGFGLAVAHHGESDQVRVVVDRPVGVRDAVAQLAALVDAAGRFGGGVAADAAGERELLEEALHPGQVFALVRVDLGIRPFEVGLGQDRRRAVPGPGDEDRVQVVLLDQPVEVDVREGLAGVRAPVAQQARLDVLELQRLAEQGVVLEVQHPQAQVEAGPPVGVDLFQLVGTERGSLDRRASGAVRGDWSVITNFLCYSCHDSNAPFAGNARLPSGCLFVHFVYYFIDAVGHVRFHGAGLSTSQPTAASRA